MKSLLWILCLTAGLAPGIRSAEALEGVSPSAEADSLIARAERAGRRGQNREAIAGYEEAARLAPERRDEIHAALAFQYAWAGRLDDAARTFALARVAHPEDYDLRMGELLVTNWMGDHLLAWEGYARAAEDYPRSAGPLTGLAAAQNWAGRRDLARRTLTEARRREPDNRNVIGLEQSISRSLRPVVAAFYDWSEDSDDYQVNGAWFEAGFSPHPQARLIPFLNSVGIRRPGTTAIDEIWVGTTLLARPATRLGLWGRLSVLTEREAGADYAPYTASLSADWTASDRLRFGLSVERFAVVSYVTLPDKITGESFGGFVEARPDWRSRLRVALDHAVYHEVAGFGTNHRWQLVAATSREVWAPARVRLGLSGRYLDFEEPVDNGIWTPDQWWAGAGLVEWEWGDRDRGSVFGALELGPAQETGGDVTLFASYRLGLRALIGTVSVEASGGHSEGNVDTGTGYDRTFAHLGLRRRF